MFSQGVQSIINFIGVQNDERGITSADLGDYIRKDLLPVIEWESNTTLLHEFLLAFFEQCEKIDSVESVDRQKVFFYVLDTKNIGSSSNSSNNNDDNGDDSNRAKSKYNHSENKNVCLDYYDGERAEAVHPEKVKRSCYSPPIIHTLQRLQEKDVCAALSSRQILKLLKGEQIERKKEEEEEGVKKEICWSYEDWYNGKSHRRDTSQLLLLRICPSMELMLKRMGIHAHTLSNIVTARFLGLTAFAGADAVLYLKEEIEAVIGHESYVVTLGMKNLLRSNQAQVVPLWPTEQSVIYYITFPNYAAPDAGRHWQRQREEEEEEVKVKMENDAPDNNASTSNPADFFLGGTEEGVGIGKRRRRNHPAGYSNDGGSVWADISTKALHHYFERKRDNAKTFKNIVLFNPSIIYSIVQNSLEKYMLVDDVLFVLLCEHYIPAGSAVDRTGAITTSKERARSVFMLMDRRFKKNLIELVEFSGLIVHSVAVPRPEDEQNVRRKAFRSVKVASLPERFKEFLQLQPDQSKLEEEKVEVPVKREVKDECDSEEDKEEEENTKKRIKSIDAEDDGDASAEVEIGLVDNKMQSPFLGTIYPFYYTPTLSLANQLVQEACYRPISLLLLAPRVQLNVNMTRVLAASLMRAQQKHPDVLSSKSELVGNQSAFTKFIVPRGLFAEETTASQEKIRVKKEVRAEESQEEVAAADEMKDIILIHTPLPGSLPPTITEYIARKFISILEQAKHHAATLYGLHRLISKRSIGKMIGPFTQQGIIRTTGYTSTAKGVPKRFGLVYLGSAGELTEEQKAEVVQDYMNSVSQGKPKHKRPLVAAPAKKPNSFTTATDHNGDRWKKSSAVSAQTTRPQLATDEIIMLRNGYSTEAADRACRLHIELWHIFFKRKEEMERRQRRQTEGTSPHDTSYQERLLVFNGQALLLEMSLSTFCIIVGFTMTDLTFHFMDSHDGVIPWGAAIKDLPPSLVDLFLLHHSLVTYEYALQSLQNMGLIRYDEETSLETKAFKKNAFSTNFTLCKRAVIEEKEERHNVGPATRKLTTAVFYDSSYNAGTTLHAVLSFWKTSMMSQVAINAKEPSRRVVLAMAQQGLHPSTEDIVLLSRLSRVSRSRLSIEVFQLGGVRLYQDSIQNQFMIPVARKNVSRKKGGALKKVVRLKGRFAPKWRSNHFLNSVFQSYCRGETGFQLVLDLLEKRLLWYRSSFQELPLAATPAHSSATCASYRDLGLANEVRLIRPGALQVIPSIRVFLRYAEKVEEETELKALIKDLFSPDYRLRKGDVTADIGVMRQRDLEFVGNDDLAPPPPLTEQLPKSENMVEKNKTKEKDQEAKIKRRDEVRLVIAFIRMVLLSDMTHYNPAACQVVMDCFSPEATAEAIHSLRNSAKSSFSSKEDGDRFKSLMIRKSGGSFVPGALLPFTTPATCANLCLLHDVAHFSSQLCSLQAPMNMKAGDEAALHLFMLDEQKEEEEKKKKHGVEATTAAAATGVGATLMAAIRRPPPLILPQLGSWKGELRQRFKALHQVYLPDISWNSTAVDAERHRNSQYKHIDYMNQKRSREGDELNDDHDEDEDDENEDENENEDTEEGNERPVKRRKKSEHDGNGKGEVHGSQRKSQLGKLYPARYHMNVRRFANDYRKIPFDPAPTEDQKELPKMLLRCVSKAAFTSLLSFPPYNPNTNERRYSTVMNTSGSSLNNSSNKKNSSMGVCGGAQQQQLHMPYPSIFRHQDGTLHTYVWLTVVDELYHYLCRAPGIALPDLELRMAMGGFIGPEDLHCALQYLIEVKAIEERQVPLPLYKNTAPDLDRHTLNTSSPASFLGAQPSLSCNGNGNPFVSATAAATPPDRNRETSVKKDEVLPAGYVCIYIPIIGPAGLWKFDLNLESSEKFDSFLPFC